MYEEGPELLWKEEEWVLFDQFKYNIREKTMPVLKKVDIRYGQYQNEAIAFGIVITIGISFLYLKKKFR